MARKPRDFDAELQALTDRTRKVKTQKTTQLGELVQLTGADTLPIEVLAGVLLASVEQARQKPEAIARWTERGQMFFQAGGKRSKVKPGDEPAHGTAGHPAPGPASPGAAE